MGEEKPELSEGRLSRQSGYSPVKQVDPNEIAKDDSSLSRTRPKVHIPNGKKGRTKLLKNTNTTIAQRDT